MRSIARVCGSLQRAITDSRNDGDADANSYSDPESSARPDSYSVQFHAISFSHAACNCANTDAYSVTVSGAFS
jgi:hypothetical protein